MTAKIHRPVKGRIRLQTPYVPDNRGWLKSIGIGRPTWSKSEGVWLVSRVHLTRLVNEAVARFGEAEVWTDHRSEERCHTACQTAVGDECVCSCMGRHHGGGAPVEGWESLGDVLVGSVIRAHWRVTAAAHAGEGR